MMGREHSEMMTLFPAGRELRCCLILASISSKPWSVHGKHKKSFVETESGCGTKRIVYTDTKPPCQWNKTRVLRPPTWEMRIRD